MKTLLLSVAIIVASSTAHAADVFFTLLLVNGKKEVHYQTTKEGKCAAAIATFREEAKQGKSITLTFATPPKVTGTVLEAGCILPDGSIGEQFKSPAS